jgi:hypothetical protein
MRYGYHTCTGYTALNELLKLETQNIKGSFHTGDAYCNSVFCPSDISTAPPPLKKTHVCYAT